MVTGRTFRLAGICLFAFICLGANCQIKPSQQVQTPKRDGNTTQGLVDFALKSVNSGDRDYGQCFDDARRLLIEETIDRIYFWSNLAALLGVIVLFAALVHQRRYQHHCLYVAAEALAQHQNALGRAQAQIAEATARNHSLMQALNAASDSVGGASASRVVESKTRPEAAEQTSQPTQLPTTGVRTTSVKTSKPGIAPIQPAHTLESSIPPANAKEKPIRAEELSKSEGPKSQDQMGLFGPEGDLVAKNNVLQRQLSISQEREKQLRRQLNDTESRLQKEQQKSRSLQA